jgi:hypothetical protein
MDKLIMKPILTTHYFDKTTPKEMTRIVKLYDNQVSDPDS